MKALLAAGCVAAVIGSCAPAGIESQLGEPAGTVRIALVGDVMLGRGVGVVVTNDPSSVFEDLRPAIVSADLALANLESPLTDRPHLVGPNALEADPASAPGLLAGAGFDAVAIANNHAGDAGPQTVGDTIAALADAGLGVIGGGDDRAAALRPYVVDHDGVRVAVLAFDLTGGGPLAGAATAGITPWDEESARAAVLDARASADVVVVGVHGGVEGLPRPDPVLRRVVTRLTEWGADVVWGNGAHVAYPVSTGTGPSGRVTVQAPGLGNALFDQGAGPGGEGSLLEVLVDGDGVIAHRTGSIASHLRSRFVGWDDPVGDAVALDGGWWTLDRPPPVAAAPVASDLPELPAAAVPVDASLGDVDGDGAVEVVVSYRRPFEPKPLHRAFTDLDLVDATGHAAHVAVYRADDATLVWGAGTLVRPIADVEVCDGSLALGFSGLDDPAITSGGAWRWASFGFITAAVLEGAADPGCADVDHDGRTDPILTGRSGTGD